MTRRKIIALMGGGFGVAWLGSRRWLGTGGATGDGTRMSFYVAGVRFHGGHHDVRVGEMVELRPAKWRGEVCYGIHTREGSRLGFVPRAVVPALEHRHRVEAHIVMADPHAVPWKRYRVTVNFA